MSFFVLFCFLNVVTSRLKQTSNNYSLCRVVNTTKINLQKSLGSHSALSVEKRKKIKRKKSRKSKRTIKKLFDHLRNESTSSCSTSSSNVTVVEVKNQNTDNKSQPITNNDTLIVINDDDLVTNNEPCPLQCSTPLSHSKHFIKDNNTPVTSNNNNSVILQNLTKEVEDLTKEINRDSYLTIDLTVDSSQNTNNQSGMNTVIDLVNASDAHDCTITSDSLSMSGDSDVTVLNTKRRKKVNPNQMKKFAKGIEKMGLKERGKLLEFITNTIFNGCDRPNSTRNSLHSIKVSCTEYILIHKSMKSLQYFFTQINLIICTLKKKLDISVDCYLYLKQIIICVF